MYEVEVGEDPWPAYAFIKADDLEAGVSKIYVGDMEHIRYDIPFVIEHAESVIIHESTHIAIYKVTQDLDAVKAFDEVDNAWDKANIYFCSRCFE